MESPQYIPNKKRNAYSSLQNYNQLKIVDKTFILDRNLLIFVSYRQISRLTILHANFLLFWLHIPFVSSNLNALSTQRVCSTLVSAHGVCVLCLSLEVLCVNSEE